MLELFNRMKGVIDELQAAKHQPEKTATDAGHVPDAQTGVSSESAVASAAHLEHAASADPSKAAEHHHTTEGPQEPGAPSGNNGAHHEEHGQNVAAATAQETHHEVSHAHQA